MQLRVLTSLILLAIFCCGCSSSDDDSPTPTSTPTTPELSKRWELRGAELESYRDAIGKLGLDLDRDTAISTGQEICQDLAIPLTDAELVTNAKRALGTVEASTTQVAELIRTTNERVCPELAP